MRDYIDSLRHPEFWVYATWLVLVTKYRQSRLGLAWAMVPSGLYAFGIGWFFSSFMGVPPREFIPHLGLGYVVYRLVTASLNEATTVFSGHSTFILDGRVRLTDYVLRVIGRGFFYFLLSVPVLAVALAISPSFDPWGLLVLPATITIVLLNIAWLGVLVGVIGARLPDVNQLVGSILMFAFLFTPILWFSDQVPISSVRGGIARANPLFHMVELVRAPLLGKPVETSTCIYLLCFLLLGWLLATVVYRRYARFVPIWI
ncbi:ABC transporter permease [Luteimonas suaedae]|uniref:ABC transporter permease n=1 Tax=Luteimonas suaedae TaxID=2605430 RepID=UPI00165A052E|nr:ABC transporter permease [Luteimonas suaedae]